MKRVLCGSEQQGQEKRFRSSLAFYGTALHSCKVLSHPEAWHAAKQLVADHHVGFIKIVPDSQRDQLVHISGHIRALNANTASFPHLLKPYARGPGDSSTVQDRSVSVRLTVLISNGELVDADCSCCPGGFQPVLGSFCPCATAVLLAAAKDAAEPADELPDTEEDDLPQWAGSSLYDALTAQQQQQHQKVLHDVLCLVHQPGCFTSGLGLEAWQYENVASSTAKIHFASHRLEGMYSYMGGASRQPSHDADVLTAIQDGDSDLDSTNWFGNGGVSVIRTLAALNSVQNNSSGADGGSDNSNTAAQAAPGEPSEAVRRQRDLLRNLTCEWLTLYGPGTIPGYEVRPKVVNQAFALLLGDLGTGPGHPLSAVVLLLRALWEYMHVHGLGRVLAKPLKMLMALRNTLLVSGLPLWVRKSVQCQIDIWEKAMLWQHAAAPLAVSGNVGLVHLLRVMQEIRQLCLHHWDSPQLYKLLTSAIEEEQKGHQQQQSDEGAAVWKEDLLSLLHLRLHMLKAVQAQNAYLQLAMAGGAWGEAIKYLLTSKERSQLLKAVSLLPRHITSLSERMSYMCQLIRLESLGAPEKLEVAARLLMGIREALEPQLQEVKVLRGSRSAYPSSISMYNGYLWKITQYAVPAEAARAGSTNSTARAASRAMQDTNEQLFAQWSNFLKSFVTIAAQALFETSKEAHQVYLDHMKAELGYDDQDLQQQQQVQGPQPATGGADSSAAAGPSHPPPRSPTSQQPAAAAAAPSHTYKPPVMRYCPQCGEHHRVEASPEPSPPPLAEPAQGAPPRDLLSINTDVFNAVDLGDRPCPMEARNGTYKARSGTGYIEDKTVLEALRAVVPVQYPELLPLCSLDALCVSTLSSAVMDHFDAGGVFDTSLPLDPLREFLSHHVVEMGPGPVRVQAALEVAVYVSIMTPLKVPAFELETLYRRLLFMLLGVGQRKLALLVARTRFKLLPSACAAAELMEVAISVGPSAETQAVDLILGKGLVRELDADDNRFLAGGPAADPVQRVEQQRHIDRAQEARARLDRRMRRDIALYGGMYDDMYGDMDDDDEDDYLDYEDYRMDLEEGLGLIPPGGPDRQVGAANPSGSASAAGGDSGADDDESDDDDEDDGDRGGEQGQPIEINSVSDDEPDATRSRTGTQGNSNQQREVQRAAAAAAAAAIAAGQNPAAAALAAARAAQGGQGADAADDSESDSSLGTRQLLGAAADTIQLKDTASSSYSSRKAAPPAAAPPPAAPAAEPPNPQVAQDAVRRRMLMGAESDDMDVEDELYMAGLDYVYGRTHRSQIRDVGPAQLQPRPGRVASSSKRYKASPSPAAMTAAGGGGGGGGGDPPGGDGDDHGGNANGDGNPRQHKGSQEKKRRRRSPKHKDHLLDEQQAALADELFGINESSHASPAHALRIHMRRLSGLLLWSVVKYAAGRGASDDSIRKLGLAAWLTDNSNGNTGHNGSPQLLRPADQLHWQAVAGSKDTWLQSMRRNFELRNQGLPAVSREPFDGQPVTSFNWSGIPCDSWSGFVGQERVPHTYSNTTQHHDSPDAHLAWLIARLAPQTEYDKAFEPASQWRGARSGFVFKLGHQGQGYYKDAPPADSMTARWSGGVIEISRISPHVCIQVDFSAAADLLQQLASLSRGLRFGLPVLQLCHALLSAGCRSSCLSLMPQGLLPAASDVWGLLPNSCLVAALQELLPVAAKHGDVSLRVNSIITDILCSRRQVPAALLADPDVLGGVLSWWLGLVGALHTQPSEWTSEKLTSINEKPQHSYYYGSMRESPWHQLQRLLLTCILPAVKAAGNIPCEGAAEASSSAAAAAAASGGTGSGLQLLVGCPDIDKAHWAFRLYLTKVCCTSGLCSNLASLSAMLCPPLAAAAQQHMSGLSEEDRAPLPNITVWKTQRAARLINGVPAARAKDWVQSMLTWVTELLNAGVAAGTPVALSGGYTAAIMLEGVYIKYNMSELAELVDNVVAAVVGSGWHGPELLPLAEAARKQQQQHKQPPSPAILSLIAAGVLPAVGRAEELSRNSCVTSRVYKGAVAGLMKDYALLEMLPKEVARNLALTYWYQEATPAALLTANEFLTKLEGESPTQQLTFPAAAAAGGVTSAGLMGLSGGSAAAGAALAGGVAGLPAVHAVLLEQLDLVPSRGGIEAAGLRFMQLQVHATAGHHEAALEAVLNVPPSNGSSAPTTAVGGSSSSSNAALPLMEAMEVADAVLRLVEDNSSLPCIRNLLASAPYRALQSLSALGACKPGAGDSLLAGLSVNMRKHVLRLLVWRSTRDILTRPPGVGQRMTTGPSFFPEFGCNFNNSHRPSAPSYQDQQVVGRWVSFPHHTLVAWGKEQGLDQLVLGSGGANIAAALCSQFQLQEEGLLWCVTQYAQLVKGVELERDLKALISLDNRARLGQLPVFIMGLGQRLRYNRELMWAYNVFRNTEITSKVNRYLRRSAHDQGSLSRYIAKSCTIAEIQGMKAVSLPWWEWNVAQKAAQAAELAEWLWWYSVDWPSMRSAATAGPQQSLPPITIVRHLM